GRRFTGTPCRFSAKPGSSSWSTRWAIILRWLRCSTHSTCTRPKVSRTLGLNALRRLGALQIGAHRQRAALIFFNIGKRRVQIKIGDMAEDQTLRVSARRYASDHGRQSLIGIVCADADRQMHDKQIGAFGEIGKSWIGPVLVRAEDDGLALRFDAV